MFENRNALIIAIARIAHDKRFSKVDHSFHSQVIKLSLNNIKAKVNSTFSENYKKTLHKYYDEAKQNLANMQNMLK